MNGNARYKTYKIIASSLRALHIPFGVYAGAELALNNIPCFVIGLIAAMLIVFVQQYIYWMTMEMLGSTQKPQED